MSEKKIRRRRSQSKSERELSKELERAKRGQKRAQKVIQRLIVTDSRDEPAAETSVRPPDVRCPVCSGTDHRVFETPSRTIMICANRACLHRWPKEGR